jgi:vacuolar protein sorting-associated protein 52
VRLREFLIEQINLLKKPKTNIQIMQKSVLGKYKVFTEFFKEQSPQIYTELCNNYREIMAKIYVNNYKAYLAEI